MKREELFSIIAVCLIIITGVILFGRGLVILGSIIYLIITLLVIMVAWAIDNIPAPYFGIVGLILGQITLKNIANTLSKDSYLLKQIISLEPMMIIITIACVSIMTITEIRKVLNRNKRLKKVRT